MSELVDKDREGRGSTWYKGIKEKEGSADSARSAAEMAYRCSGANQPSTLIFARSPKRSGNKTERPAAWGTREAAGAACKGSKRIWGVYRYQGSWGQVSS